MDQSIQRKVYVIDDDEAVRDSLRVVLESYGLEVRDYGSALEFLAQLCRQPKGCLLLDVHMPEMDGIELLELLRERGSKLPVVMFTGRNDTSLKERAKRAGAIELLDKPVNDDVLFQTLDRAFQAQAAL